MWRKIKGNTTIRVFAILIAIILFAYITNRVVAYHYKYKYENNISNYLLKSKEFFLSINNKDTIYINDSDFNECSMDSRGFIAKENTRPFISSELKNLGFKTVIFTQIEELVSINGGQSFGCSIPVVKENKPCYSLHIWTETYGGLFPDHRIDIEESYYSVDSLKREQTTYIHSLFEETQKEFTTKSAAANK